MGEHSKLMPFSSGNSNIKYVTVEVIRKDTVEKNLTAIKTADITYGIFSGLRAEKENNLIYISKVGEDKSLIGLSLDVYNIMRIEIAHGNYKEELFYQKYAHDQVDAKEDLAELMTMLPVKEGTSFVEINKYDTTSLKDEKREIKIPTTSYSDTHNNTCGYNNRSGGWSGYNNGYNKTTTTLTEQEKKKLVKPFAFRRKANLPTEENLINMLERVRQIKNNTYVQPDFLATKVMDGKEWEGATSKVDDIYNECFYC